MDRAMDSLADSRRLRISEAHSGLIEHWREGASLERETGSAVKDFVVSAARDRLRLAEGFMAQANAMLELPALGRSAVSRYYYAMYHAARAAEYLSVEGDDHQEHMKLPSHLPRDIADLDDCTEWLSRARLKRNEADYDPYPQDPEIWRREAVALQEQAQMMLDVVRSYLQGKGCGV